jgi:hypothetical protein
MSFTNMYEYSKHIAFLKRKIISYHFTIEAVWQGLYEENKKIAEDTTAEFVLCDRNFPFRAQGNWAEQWL